ncbi:GNAT family N-acetyltransferase [Pseudomonas sp. 5P_5.1_Bac1]|uniref:GNAT family N-acetyltransferase n=1 Tax=Pseudomonas sp. 5P_5.1_Bac1 TaxID=2971616 RepID=UPI0021C8134A|nr:GNAT family N-acetyltransferase [Pseudomonas sp. 5P_5.1_Bac1]MCU1724877.1 GNAT family N-acetyltransferase [Pseudomonas sp. 5P_5.1_Bac1]
MGEQVRTARPDDAEAISQVILSALRESNARDYPPAVIEQVAANFSPRAVAVLLEQRTVLVAELGGQVVATASLDGEVVRSVFVAPTHQGRGVGQQLMAAIETLARSRGVALLSVPSSVTAEPFYARLGFTAVREVLHDEERTIVMQRVL